VRPMKSTSETASQKMLAAVGRTVIVIFAVLATLEIVSYAAWSTARRFHHAPLRPETSPAYAGADWVPELYREQSSRMALRFTYVPFRVVGMAPWRGHYYNNDEHPSGVWRRTINPECQQKQESKLWIFGGSTVYGTGVPDWATLPSSLSRNLNADSRTCMTVTNFGNEGYATTQELLLLIEQLKRSGSPDVVIFYDGFNDARLGMEAPDPWNTYSGWETIKPRAEGSFSGRFDFIHQFYTMRVLEAAQQLFRHTAASLNPDELRAKAVTVIDNYEANQSIARALSQTYHF
jgi:lysophospholipase L1-like esterase